MERRSDPEHNVTLPFTRMFLGPDGLHAGRHAQRREEDFATIFEQPMSLGTRCHQLAMYVVFESPLQMLADSPVELPARAGGDGVPGPGADGVGRDARARRALGDYVLVARRAAATGTSAP